MAKLLANILGHPFLLPPSELDNNNTNSSNENINYPFSLWEKKVLHFSF